MTDYIATTPLFVGMARAHNVGDSVPADNVEPNGWTDGVARAGTKAAEDALKSARDAQSSYVEPLPVSEQAPQRKTAAKRATRKKAAAAPVSEQAPQK